jgi:hypothetical protein
MKLLLARLWLGIVVLVIAGFMVAGIIHAHGLKAIPIGAAVLAGTALTLWALVTHVRGDD